MGSFLLIKPIGFLTPLIQIVLICILFIITVLIQYREYKRTGKVWGGHYPLKASSFFAAIYEEVLFRGFILFGLMTVFTILQAVIISSLLFGLWHLKNIFYLSKKQLWYQMFYTGIIFAPVVSYITLVTGTIWIAVILHFCNNLLATATLGRIHKNEKPL